MIPPDNSEFRIAPSRPRRRFRDQRRSFGVSPPSSSKPRKKKGEGSPASFMMALGKA